MGCLGLWALRVGSGHTSPPGVELDPSRRQLDQRDLRRGGPRLPELDEEPAEGRGEPRTIERPRMRARFVDQGEPVRPPGRGGDTTQRRRPHPGSRARDRRRRSQQDQAEKTRRRRGRNRKRLGGEVGPRNRRGIIGKRAGAGRTEGREEPLRDGGEEAVRHGGEFQAEISVRNVRRRVSVRCLLAPSRGVFRC